MLFQCWPTVFDAGPTLKQHWVNASCWELIQIFDHVAATQIQLRIYCAALCLCKTVLLVVPLLIIVSDSYYSALATTLGYLFISLTAPLFPGICTRLLAALLSDVARGRKTRSTISGATGSQLQQQCLEKLPAAIRISGA